MNYRYSNHPIILSTNEKASRFNLTFSFNKVDPDKISFEIKRLDFKKASKSNDIPTRIIKEFKKIFFHLLFKNYNECLDKDIFPDDLKLTKKIKNSYSPVSILSNISKYVKDVCNRKLMNILNLFF